MSKAQPEQSKPTLEAEISKMVSDVVSAAPDVKKAFKTMQVSEVKEYQCTTEDKKTMNAVVVYLPYTFMQSHRALVPKIVNEIQKRKNRYAFVVAKRTVIHKKSDFKQKIPRNRTLTAVYDSLLEDLISPANVIGKRYRYRLNGTQLMKVHLSEDARSFLEDRTELIAQLYFNLTNRKVAFEFRPEPCYIRVPKLKLPGKKTHKPKA